MKDKVLAELKNVFKPEFLNRIDSTVVFHSLTRRRTSARSSTSNCARSRSSCSTKGVTPRSHRRGKDWLGEKGYDPVFGARPLRRVIQDSIEDKLSEMLLSGEFGAGRRRERWMPNDDGLVIEPVREPAAVG